MSGGEFAEISVETCVKYRDEDPHPNPSGREEW
jgi:hypothetical protein